MSTRAEKDLVVDRRGRDHPLYCLFPIAWIISLSFNVAGGDLSNGSSCRRSHRSNYTMILTGGAKDLSCRRCELLRHLPVRHRDRRRPGHVRGLRHRPAGLPGQEADPPPPPWRWRSSPSSPRDADLQPLAGDRAVRHPDRPDHPLPVADAADLIWTMSAFFKRDPLGDGAGGPGRRRHQLAGVPEGDRPAGRSPASSPPRSSRSSSPGTTSSSRISLTSTSAARPSRRPWRCSPARRSSRADGRDRAAAVIVTIPVVILVLLFQRRIVAGLTNGAVKG